MKDNIYNWKKKGKEYNNGILIYEGEYYMNKKYNGKAYDKNGNVIYELINGKGNYKEFYENGNIKLDITYSNDLTIGIGKEYNENKKLIFEGEYKNNKRWNGKGYDTNNNIVYEIQNGNGYIREYSDKDKLKFEGEYKNGQKDGVGKEYSNGILLFEGEYKNGKRN